MPKKTKAKLKFGKEAAEDAKLAAVNPEKDPLEDTDDKKEMPVAAKRPNAAFTITALDLQASSATDETDVVSIECKKASQCGFTPQQLRDFNPIVRNPDGGHDNDGNDNDNSDIFDEDHPFLKLVKIPCHILAAKFPDQHAMETVVFDPTVADVLDDKKWVISMVQTVEK